MFRAGIVYVAPALYAVLLSDQPVNVKPLLTTEPIEATVSVSPKYLLGFVGAVPVPPLSEYETTY